MSRFLLLVSREICYIIHNNLYLNTRIMNKRLGDFTKFKEEVLNYAKNKFISSQ